MFIHQQNTINLTNNNVKRPRLHKAQQADTKLRVMA